MSQLRDSATNASRIAAANTPLNSSAYQYEFNAAAAQSSGGTFRGQPLERGRPPPVCWYCKLPGHQRHECPTAPPVYEPGTQRSPQPWSGQRYQQQTSQPSVGSGTVAEYQAWKRRGQEQQTAAPPLGRGKRPYEGSGKGQDIESQPAKTVRFDTSKQTWPKRGPGGPSLRAAVASTDDCEDADEVDFRAFKALKDES